MYGVFPTVDGVDTDKLTVSKKNIKCVTPARYAQRCVDEIEKTMGTRNLNIVETCGGNGGDTIAFATRFAHVTSIEKDFNDFKILQNNILEYKLQNVLLLAGSYLDFPNILAGHSRSSGCDVLYIDPPWGDNYKKFKRMHLFLDSHNIIDLVDQVDVPLIVIKVPYNYKFFDLRQYLENRGCSVWSCPVRNYFLVFVKKIKTFARFRTLTKN